MTNNEPRSRRAEKNVSPFSSQGSSSSSSKMKTLGVLMETTPAVTPWMEITGVAEFQTDDVPLATLPGNALKCDLSGKTKASVVGCNCMNVSLELRKDTAENVAQAASRAGKDVCSFLEDFVARSFSGETMPRRSVAEILAPFQAEIEASGLTDQQLDTLFSEARDQVFTHRRQTGT